MTSPGELTPNPRALRDDIVNVVVAKLAPEELPMVDALHGLDDEVALKRLTERPRRDEPLGFGLEVAGALLTPVLWIAVDEAVRRIVSAAEQETRTRLVRRRPFGRRRDPVPASAPSLTRQQLETVEQAVLAAARQARLSSERGERIADAVVRRLALAQPDGGQSELPTGGDE
ncbi:hypothetical protein GCM10022403_023340 [Streptomyces coacervatus]|uniref:Uncharacterized protein n=1 Tax=Streptomyces coacervatus TaxID=647381 RepID=A0ABP7H8R2_9ACTN|nr:hypothetical protein [Streptomyces coacervatus]MDF2265908.1 hypothetical protein [Streptomyces coacervatus]